MRQMICLFCLLGSMFDASAQQAIDDKPALTTAKASIVQQKYCRAVADVFTVSLKLKIRVHNSSRLPVYLLWPLIPWEGKVASSITNAEAGYFLYDQTASHYLQDEVRFKRLKVEPGKTVKLQSGYDLIARRDPAFSLPDSVSAGSYALVLVLRPEESPPTQLQDSATLQSITIAPFTVDVPTNPNFVDCGAEER
jgi:hypothetical protein